MIGRFFLLMMMLLVATGLLLHYQVDVAWMPDWVGTLPGDMIIKKQGLKIYVPLSTSVLTSLTVLMFCSFFLSDKK